MLTYEYTCTKCTAKNFEVEQKITDEPLTTCRFCSRESLQRVIAPVGTHFKGSGWTPKGRRRG